MDTGLYRLFCEHWNACGLGASDPTPVFERLVSAYSEPWRHYHTLQHLGECLDELHFVTEAPALADSVHIPVIGLSLWFHDIVYDARASDNEERSAAVASEVLSQANAAAELPKQVSALILATKAHVVSDANDLNTALLLDIDLSILGKSPERFAEYERQIHAEYDWVPSQVYVEKRREVLQGFLNRPSLFLTDPFKSRFETQARQNLQHAIQRLG